MTLLLILGVVIAFLAGHGWGAASVRLAAAQTLVGQPPPSPFLLTPEEEFGFRRGVTEQRRVTLRALT